MPPLDPNCITPANDPELFWFIQELKKYKQEGFFGTISLHMEGGLLQRYEAQQMHKVPKEIVTTPRKT